MIYTSIDIGIFNLGLVVCEVNTDWSIRVIHAERINIKELCTECRDVRCRFKHALVFTDYIDHFVFKYDNYLKHSKAVLIERQPPQGFVAVQELIMSHFRDTTILVSPNSVHKFFEIGHLDYDGRKVASINIAKNIHAFDGHRGRIHDIADAICMLIYQTSKMKKAEADETLRLQKLDPFNRYRYNAEDAEKKANIDKFLEECRYSAISELSPAETE